MDPSSDEMGVAGSSGTELHEPLSPLSPLSPTRQFLGRLPSLPLPRLGRRKSTGQELQSSTANPSETRKTRELEISQAPLRPTKPRSQSNASQHDWKSEWATALVAHESMQSSFKELRTAVDEYEAKVSGQKWEVLSSDWAELEALAKNAREKQETSKQPRSPLGKFMDRFSAVALEYSKLLDVVWNNSPEYAGLVWGVTKILLVANINHANLKQNVASCLISIGERLGPVNQLVNYSPTDKMVTAVAMLYASYNKFLQKALKYYGQSKLAAALETFTFPWETKFQKVIAQIDYQFRLIYELSHANHFHATVETKILLHSIHTCQQEDRDAFQQAYSTEKLRSEIREEVKQEIFDLLESFNCKWVQRFDEMLLHKTGQDKEQTQKPEPEDSCAQPASATPETEVFLADFVSELEDLAEFRDSVFPLLQSFQRWEDHIRVTKRYLTVYDQQHILKVLRAPDMGDWMSSDNSGVVWIDSHPHSKTVDWMSVLATQLIDDASCYEYRTILSHFCLGHTSGNAHSTISLLIESLIFQLLLRHREDFSARNISLTQRRFQDAQDDITALWSLFLDVLNSSKSTCAWLIIDKIDILRKESGAEGLDKVLMLVRYLYELAESPSMIVKILITARLGGPVLLSKEIADASILSPAHPVLHVPRGHHRSEAAFLAKYMKRCSRLPESDSLVSLEAPGKSLSIEALLAESESEDEDPVETHSAIDRKQDSLFVQNNKSDDASEDDFASFMDEDPFASSSDEEWDVPIAVDRNPGLQSSSAADSVGDVDSLQDYFGVQAIDNSMHEIERNTDHEVSADPDQQTGSAKSPTTPKIVIDFLDYSFSSHAADPVSEAENSASQSKVALHESQTSTQSTLKIEKGKRIEDFFESDSDEDRSSS